MLLCSVITSQAVSQTLSKKLGQFAKDIASNFDEVSAERKAALEEIGDYMLASITEHNEAQLVIICTHNSRRSQITQAMTYLASEYYGVANVKTFSGGLEVTAFHPNAVAALKRAGFWIEKSASGDNPTYLTTLGKNYSQMLQFSKEYGHQDNPTENFAAIMVCSDADKSCPLVSGADRRFSLPYDDPRYFDGKPAAEQKYDETVATIGKEIFYLVDYVKQQQILVAEANK
ncbi:MAG TPA: protein-tyrosine-phosphatase [Cytophagales bacterium]|nr:protein-tyrosine-phosphatase [Cytophagales bacterium]HAA20361.1 protein-tyrosine-phosphatase [Cytophagales bacterium]HAP60861.1 protein-tyrosine-phosphatase [Cytophagales bacterium]